MMFRDDVAHRAPTSSEIKGAFDDLVASNTFAGSDRLIGFLDYVVTEKLEGRGELIRAKSIGLDLYGYEPDEIERRESVVRVDAGRLRKKLDQYYSQEALDQTIRIVLPKGRYSPIFHTQLNEPPKKWTVAELFASRHGKQLVLAISAGVCLVAVIVWTLQSTPPLPKNTERALRAALFDTSPERLQAVNLAGQGRDLIFPATDLKRLGAAMQVFETVVSLDETYDGGHAGISQISGVLSLLSTDEVKTTALLQQSKEQAKRAIELSPDSPWAISAQAWAEFAGGDYSSALSWSNRAKKLAPDDPYVLEFDALIMLYAGDFEKLVQEVSNLPEQNVGKLNFVYYNAQSAAYYHLQNYNKAVSGFEAAIAGGAPAGPVTVAYLMAANHHLGHKNRASELAQKYNETWPGQRVDLLFQRLFKNPEHGRQLAAGMRLAGWVQD